MRGPDARGPARSLHPAVGLSDALDAAFLAARYADLEALRRAEVDTVGALAEQIAGVTAARAGQNVDDEHDPEGATIGFERAQADALLAVARRRLGSIDAALARCAAGDYGRCTVCGAPIPQARLAARPDAATCVRHA